MPIKRERFHFWILFFYILKNIQKQLNTILGNIINSYVMCGIIAGISSNISTHLLDGLKQLQNRGYDSAGIALMANAAFYIKKYASTEQSALDKLQHDIQQHSSKIGIGHTRWATHGPKTDINSHPHISYGGNFALVHNGIIENYAQLKKELEIKSIYSISDTDSEIIVNLIEYYYHMHKNIDIAIKTAISRLQGTWGLVIMSIFENTLYCTRQGSPLLISINNNMALIASEQSAFCNKTINYISLNNHDICKVYLKDNKIAISTQYVYKTIPVTSTLSALTPDPYHYWTEKEIYEQKDSCLRAISLGGRLLSNDMVKLGGLENHKSQLLQLDNLILLGCGTSYFAGMCGKIYFKDMCDFDSIQLIDGAEFELNDVSKRGKTGLILLSQSGETKDLHRCLELCVDIDVITIGIINVVDSLIAREVDCGLYLNAGREVGVASTKSFTSQVILLSMMAIWFAQIKNINLSKRIKYIRDLRRLHFDVETVLTNIQMEQIITIFENHNNCFVLGKGFGQAIAYEGALKIKEISYIHAEGYSSSSLKHGPFALLKKDYPVILIAPQNKFFSKNMNVYEEIKSRYATIILITDNYDIDLPYTINIPQNDSYGDLLCVIPLQLLALKLSISRGFNPDMPRNLAKVVTVE